MLLSQSHSRVITVDFVLAESLTFAPGTDDVVGVYKLRVFAESVHNQHYYSYFKNYNWASIIIIFSNHTVVSA